MPWIKRQLEASEWAYKDYLIKHKKPDTKTESSPVSGGGGRYDKVIPESPNWQKLRKKHKMPEDIKTHMEASLAKEIPETTH